MVRARWCAAQMRRGVRTGAARAGDADGERARAGGEGGRTGEGLLLRVELLLGHDGMHSGHVGLDLPERWVRGACGGGGPSALFRADSRSGDVPRARGEESREGEVVLADSCCSCNPQLVAPRHSEMGGSAARWDKLHQSVVFFRSQRNSNVQDSTRDGSPVQNKRWYCSRPPEPSVPYNNVHTEIQSMKYASLRNRFD
jgi:hypothetical protein